MSKVAVIGCGIFGATTALKLKSDGHDVTLFERLSAPLTGASHNNQNRLHLGFHYPRDSETARQSIRGISAFEAAFPECIVSGFPSAYFIAAQGSQTTPVNYLAFCDALGLKYRVIEPSQFEPKVQNAALGILTEEAVYDSALLRKHLHRCLREADLSVQFGTEAIAAKESWGQITLTLHDSKGDVRADTFDVVVNATYANISRLTGSLGLPLVERQYEYVVIPIIEAPFGRTGITVMDGNFMSVLPFGASNFHLLYHVEHSVIARSVGYHAEDAWLNMVTSPFSYFHAEALFQRMREAACQFVPALADARLVNVLRGTRVVLASRDDTDARPSIIEHPRPGYFSIFSGKVNHCLWVADEIAAAIDRIES